MQHNASLSFAKIAVLASLLFVSNAAYAEDELLGTWQYGYGIKSAVVSAGSVGDFSYPSTNLAVVEIASIRDYADWSIQFSLGAALDRNISGVYNNASLSPASVFYFGYTYFGVTVLNEVSSSVSLGLSNMYTTTTIIDTAILEPNFYSRTSDSNWGFALSFHKPGQNHAFEVNLGEDASTIGYRWTR